MLSYFNGKKVIVFGGTGFIGNHLVNSLCKQSCQIEIISRNPQKKKKKFFSGEPGQVSIKKITDFSEKNIEYILKGADVVINLIGILYETKNSKFKKVHVEIPKNIAKVTKKVGIDTFIHLSALKVEKSKFSDYANSKYQGENEIKSVFPNAIILKPSVVFGKGDNFTNLFSKISTFSPALPIIGTPKISFKNNLPSIDFNFKVKFQPLYVGDLVNFLILSSQKKGKSFELAGPYVKSFDQIYDVILKAKNRKRIYFPLPFLLAKPIAFLSRFLPEPIITSDQLKLLTVNSVSMQGFKNLSQYIKNPKSMEVIVDSYL